MRPPCWLSSVPLVAILLLLQHSPANAYVRWTDFGVALYRTDFGNVRFVADPSVKAGLRNADGELVITPDSDPLAALQSAMNTWSTVPTSRARFAPLQVASVPVPVRPNDWLNVITLIDTPAVRSVLGSAAAITFLNYFRNGEIIDADILFNPTYSFSTTLAPDTLDLQAVATHELGHALGAQHSSLRSATMFPVLSFEQTRQRRLSADDIAFVTDAYPNTGAAGQLGAIAGRLTFPSGAAVRGALLVAIDPAAGIAVGGVSSTADGAYKIGSLPPGAYQLYAEPLGGAVQPLKLGLSDTQVDLDWQPSFYGGVASPLSVPVAGGDTSRVDFAVDSGPSPIRIDSLGFYVAADTPYPGFGLDNDVLPSGQAMELLFGGKGFDKTIRPADILLLGPGLSLRADSIQVQALGDQGFSTLRAVVDVAPRAGWDLVVPAVRRGDAVAVYSGLRIAPTAPRFKPSGTVNAASLRAGGVAPGEIVSLFGVGLGPPTGIAARLSEVAQRLPTSLEDVTVTFDGLAAPLLYASTARIDLQVPFEVAGRDSTLIQVHYQDAASEEAVVPVVAASPAIFGAPQKVFNQDGALNSPLRPAPRGSTVVLYANGQGIVDPPLETGQAAPVAPLSRVRDLTARVGELPVPVSFTGMVPGFVGLLQVNVVIPLEAPPGDFLPLRFIVGGIASPAGAFVAVR